MPKNSCMFIRISINYCTLGIHIIKCGIASSPRNTARRLTPACRITRHRTANHADIINGCAVQHTKKSGIVNAGNLDVLDAEEVAVEFPLERCRMLSNGRMCRTCIVNIVCEHIVARKIRCVDVSKVFFRTDQLIVVVCRRCSCAVDLIIRRCRCVPAFIADMGIAAVCRRIGVEDAIRRRHIRRIEEADMSAVYLDTRRCNLSHIDNIGLQCGSIVERRCPPRLKGGFYSICDSVLCGDMKMPDVDHGRLAKDHAVRIDDVDVLAALNRTVDIRGVRARDDIQIVVGLRDIICVFVIVIAHTFSTCDRVIPPLDHLVRI